MVALNNLEKFSVLLLSAGRGSRLGIIGKKKPKSLLKINSITILRRIVDYLISKGLKELNIVVQINGKKRSVITTENNLNEEDLIKIINETHELKKFLIDKEIVRNIFVKDKLINLIIK